MILEVGRKYQLNHRWSKNNHSGKIIVTIVYFNGATLMFRSEDNGRVYESDTGTFPEMFNPYNPILLRLIYKRRASAFKPR